MGLDGLQDALRIAQTTYMKARMQTMPDKDTKMELLRQYIDKCVPLIKEAQAAMAPPPPPPQQGLGPHVAADVQRMTAHNAAQNLMGA
jgi:hypothetical protein